MPEIFLSHFIKIFLDLSEDCLALCNGFKDLSGVVLNRQMEQRNNTGDNQQHKLPMGQTMKQNNNNKETKATQQKDTQNKPNDKSSLKKCLNQHRSQSNPPKKLTSHTSDSLILSKENIIPGPPERALLLPATFTGSLGLFYTACRQLLKDWGGWGLGVFSFFF